MNVNLLKIVRLFCLIVLSVNILSAQDKISINYQQYLKNKKKSRLTDFSYAGYGYGSLGIPQISKKQVVVTDCGIFPNTGKDLTRQIQNVIDSVGKSGGGEIFFPSGTYCVNMDTSIVQFITIDYDNVVIKGNGKGKDGTIFFSGSHTLQSERNPWLSPAVFRTGYKLQDTRDFWGVEPLKAQNKFFKSGSAADPGADSKINTVPMHGKIIKKSARNTNVIYVDNTVGIAENDVLLVAMYNTSKEGNLIRKLLGYNDTDITAKHGSVLRAGEESVASYQILLEVKKVVGKNKLILKQNLKEDIELQFQPAFSKAEMLNNVGFEDFSIESAWDGNYLHHGGGKNTPYMSMMMDYGWNGINMCRVIHGWIRNVGIRNFINPVYLQDSKNITVDNLYIRGYNGHCGIKVYAHACDNLIQNVHFTANFTHMLSGEGNAYGNVFRNIKFDSQNNQKPGDFDFHGFAHYSYSPPAYNLFENIQGLGRISGGGASDNMPHTAKGNVWWNILSKIKIRESDEIFEHWMWAGKNYTPKRTDQHITYPGSIVIGFKNSEGELRVDKSASDRNEDKIIVESLNMHVKPQSLYEAQLTDRLKARKSNK